MPEPTQTPPRKPKKSAATSSDLAALIAPLERLSTGTFDARVDVKALSGDAAQAGRLVNALMEQVQTRLVDANQRKERTQIFVEQTIAGLDALVRQGELASFQARTEDEVLSPLLEGFSKVIETLRTFVREINEAALRL
jgi:uncharacterized protein (UPF0335 family)